jgi:hypothetical protein
MIYNFLDMCQKSHRITNAVSVVSQTVNFVRSKGFIHRQFEDFLTDMETEHGYILCCIEAGRMGHGWMLHARYDSKTETVYGNEDNSSVL